MKSVVKNTEVQQKSEYPCLKIYDVKGHEEHHNVVLFTSENYGTCVGSIGSKSILGETGTWVGEAFKPFTGTIELSN